MAQLDRLLAAMVSNLAEALVLDADAPAQLEVRGELRAITKSALTAAQITAVLKEAAPADSHARLDATSPVTFGRVTGEGAFTIRAMVREGRWHVEAKIDDAAEFKRMTGQFKAMDLPPEEPETPGARLTPASVPAVPAGAPPAATPAPEGSRVSTAARKAAALDEIGAFEGSAEARSALDALLRTMVEKGASDLHLRVGEPPILRHHGEMQRMDGMAPFTNDQLSRMIRSIMPERNRVEYDESNDSDYAYEISGVARFRANAARDRMGAVAVFRQIPATVVTVEQMNITPEVQRLCYLTKGLVLVTGPTGSGKSTTLCALVDLVNRSRSDHVITIEDPIEFVHPNKACIITQRQVGVHTKSFKSALRAALREDPDIILVGEMRDLETVSIAIETAETGHLVFGTLHTTTAAGTIDRIIDQFPADRQEQIRVMLAESLKGVISQTLCKKIGGGRVAAREVLLSMPSITNLIREAKTFQINSVIQTSRKLGMVTLNDALIAYVDAGQVEPKEAFMKSVEKTGFTAMLKARGLDVSFAESDATAKAPEPAGAAARPGVGRR